MARILSTISCFLFHLANGIVKVAGGGGGGGSRTFDEYWIKSDTKVECMKGLSRSSDRFLHMTRQVRSIRQGYLYQL